MASFRVSEDVVPIGRFKAEAPRWLRRVAETRQPLLITLNGRPAGVLLSPAEYDRMQERQRFLDEVAAGLADAEAGRLLPLDAVRRKLGIAGARGARTR